MDMINRQLSWLLVSGWNVHCIPQSLQGFWCMTSSWAESHQSVSSRLGSGSWLRMFEQMLETWDPLMTPWICSWWGQLNVCLELQVGRLGFCLGFGDRNVHVIPTNPAMPIFIPSHLWQYEHMKLKYRCSWRAVIRMHWTCASLFHSKKRVTAGTPRCIGWCWFSEVFWKTRRVVCRSA